MRKKIQWLIAKLTDGTPQKMLTQLHWIYQYGRRYWKAMILYTVLGVAGTGISLVSSFISKDLVDIITGHQTGELLRTFAAMIGFSMVNVIVTQATSYASIFINLKVDAEIKNDIFSKIRYLMIRCIRTGIVLSQASTWLLICAAAAFRSSRISSSRSSCPGSATAE